MLADSSVVFIRRMGSPPNIFGKLSARCSLDWSKRQRRGTCGQYFRHAISSTKIKWRDFGAQMWVYYKLIKTTGIEGDKVSSESWMHFKICLISISFIRSDRAESIEIGPDILFSCSIKTQRRIHVSVSRRSALICHSCDSMRSVTTPRGLASTTTMSRRTKTKTVTVSKERKKSVNYLFFIYYSIIHKLFIHFLSRSRLTLGLNWILLFR